MTKTIAENEYDFIKEINQLTEQLPDRGFDGLSCALLLLNDVCVTSEEECLLLSNEKNDAIISFLKAAQEHLYNAPDQKTMDKLVGIIHIFSKEMFLDSDDIELIEQTLKQDQATDTKGSSFEDIINNNRNQFNLFKEQAETQELSGIIDVIYLVEDWLEQHVEDQSLSTTSLSVVDDIIIGLKIYLVGDGDPIQNIENLIKSIHSLEETSLLDEEDSDLLKTLLQEDLALITKQSAAPEKVKNIVPEINSHSELEHVGESIKVPVHLIEYLEILTIVFLPITTSLSQWGSHQEHIINGEALENLEEDLQKFTTIAQTAEFMGLHQSGLQVLKNLSFLKTEEGEIIDLFCQWSQVVSAYLTAPLDEEIIQKLLLVHCSQAWPVVMEEKCASHLLMELKLLGKSDETENEQRQRIANKEDISLALPEDVSAILVDSLLEELPEQTATFSTAIEQLSQGGSMDVVTVAQRVAHTLKGAGNTVGVKGIANLTHHLEDILTALADNNLLPNVVVLNVLQRASDCLEEMTESLVDNSSEPQDALDVLQGVLDLARRIDDEGIVHIIQTDPSSKELDVSSLQSEQPAETIEERRKTPRETEQMVRLPVSSVDKLLQFSDEMIINNGQLTEKLRQAVLENKLLQTHLEQFHQHSTMLLELVDMQRIYQSDNQVVSSNDFDSLEMDQYNELYSTSLRIHEMTSDSREMNRHLSHQLREIDTLLIDQGYLNSTSQNSLLDVRTIPVHSISSRLQRGVRQAVRMTGKDVDFQIYGQDLLVDRDVLNNVLDPLMHLLRNAVGHGIENKEGRLKAGKSIEGSISVKFHRKRNMVAIDCIDDGGGLNLDAIKNKALKIGMITEDSDLTDDELKQLIMQPNFSTEESVSQISGRGVGMDAVNSGIRELGGTLRIESEMGKGCSFYILLPLSLAHHTCLLINIGSQVLAISELGIEQILLADAGDLSSSNDEYNFIFDEKKYAVKTIESLLSRVRPDQNIAIEKRIFLLVNHQGKYFAIAVESIKSVKEVIVKELKEVLPHIHGVIGASLLDDGSVTSVMDLQELLQEPSRWRGQTDEALTNDVLDEQTYVMVVDDSLSARRSLEQFFCDMGYQVMVARDGLDAIEQLEERLPDIIVTDLEMPRVNGIELTEYLRRNNDTKELPIIMITSRATAKHKQMAKDKGVDAYLTKPYSEDELSSTVLELCD